MKNNFFPLQFVILGYLLIGFGIYFLIRSDWVGFIMIPAGMVFSFLIISKTERIEAGLEKERDAALEKGKEIAKALDKKLLDYTSGKSVWVELQKEKTN